MKAVIIGGVVAFLSSVLLTRVWIRVMVRKQFGQFVRDDGPTSHHTKRGTPTMGGATIIVSVLLAYLAAHVTVLKGFTPSGLLVLFLFCGLGLLGFLDDWTKISKERSLGLGAGAKLVGQAVISIAFTVGALTWRNAQGVTPASAFVSLTRDLPLFMSGWPFWALLGFALVWFSIIIAGASNGTNLTDGLDGLLAGSAMMVFMAYGVLHWWQFSQSCTRTKGGPGCYTVADPLDLSVIAIAIGAACVGFLWWNANPAKIFMGDTGSMALGGALAGLAICSRSELMLVVLGGLFVLEVLSDVLQVGYFKATKGKRLFKMAPIHHHFELLGWDEVTVVIRFWIICGVLVSAGLALFYGEWVSWQ